MSLKREWTVEMKSTSKGSEKYLFLRTKEEKWEHMKETKKMSKRVGNLENNATENS